MDELMNGRFTVRDTICKDRAYRVYDQASRRDVFLKCWSESDSAAFNEIAMLTGIDSPYTPHFICTFEEDGKRYLAEEWIEGETLAALMRRRGAFSFDCAAEIIKALCDALSFLHWSRNGAIAFLDLKPSNILVRGDLDSGVFGTTLVDYEAARRLSANSAESSVRETATYRLGSPYYTAPEVIFGVPAVTCDIFSLGVLLYAMLTGEEGYPQPQKLRGSAARIIEKCTAPDPEKRYPDVSTVKEVLVQAKQRAHRRRCPARITNTQNPAKDPAAEPAAEVNTAGIRSGSRKVLGNYRRYSVMIDCNACFASELAHVASDTLELRTGVFAISEKGQRNLEYYFLNLNRLSELVCEDYYPFIFDHQTLYMRSKVEWTERGLLHACSDKLFIGSSKLLLELPLRSAEDFSRFFDWCHANFDLVLFTAERQDDPADIDQVMKYCSCIITTPLSNVEDLEAYRDYYVSLADNKRVILSKVRFVAWDYSECCGLSKEQLAQIVGQERYLGEVSHNESRMRKKNRLPVETASGYGGEDVLQYESIIERLIG